jgi:DNA-binding CsgD family transcriptional regulator
MQRGEGLGSGPPGSAPMTARESEILAWVAAGKSDWAIGRILDISGKTVNFHVENAKRKLGVGTRVQAVIAAMRSGLIGS